MAVGHYPLACPDLIDSAPFLSYGLGSLYAARQSALAAIRLYLVGTLVFAIGVLLASVLHLSLFSPARASRRVWFASFGIATAALGISCAVAVSTDSRSQGVLYLAH